MQFFEFRQEMQAVLCGLVHVKQDHINRLDFHLAESRTGILRSVNLETHHAGYLPA
jgi:hypothetical protein